MGVRRLEPGKIKNPFLGAGILKYKTKKRPGVKKTKVWGLSPGFF